MFIFLDTNGDPGTQHEVNKKSGSGFWFILSNASWVMKVISNAFNLTWFKLTYCVKLNFVSVFFLNKLLFFEYY